MTFSASQPNPKVGLVLSAGGARAAYQVGVLRYVGEHFPDFNPGVYTGISAGSINTCFLAQGAPFCEGSIKLYELWESLTFEQVFQTNFKTFASLFLRWLYDLTISKVTHNLLLKSLLDASPLAHTLLNHIHFWKISKAIRENKITGIALSATDYQTGHTTVFYDTHLKIDTWKRSNRIAIQSSIRLRHVMASCSIPIIFEPIRIGESLYGDGSLRFSFPFSPAIRLGATHILSIGIRSDINPTKTSVPEHVSLGFIAGSVLDSIFLDSIETDFENLQRINRYLPENSPKKISAELIRPSQDLGVIATAHLSHVPFHFRQILRSTAQPEELGDLLSYLLFTPSYMKALLELGYNDAKNQSARLEDFIKNTTKIV